MASRGQQKRKAPKSPDQIQAEKIAARARDLAAVNIPSELAALPNGEDIDVNHAERDKVDSARRLDAFDALKSGMGAGVYDAARRLERDVIVRRGEHDKGRRLMRVDEDEGAREFGRLDRMMVAGERVDAVLALLGLRERWLLLELIAPPAHRSHWRETVQHITGETHAHAQGAAVRAACVNLRDAYDRLERKAA